MSGYKFDGKELRSGSNKLGTINGNNINDSHGSKIGSIDGKIIRDAHGSKVGEFDGQTVRDASGTKITTIEDVRKQIDGVGGMSLVALWVLLVH